MYKNLIAKTSCPFPLLIYKTHIKYNEVKNASGIAYILLDLIYKTSDSENKICDVLLKFGIPSDLHYIFAKEISGLIGYGVLESRYPDKYFTDYQYFKRIDVGDIKLTSKGRKMFIEGAIPTRQEKEKAINIFYSPVTRLFNIESKLAYSDINGGVLTDGFFSTFDNLDKSRLEEYIKSNLSKIGIKKQEIVIDITAEEPEKKTIKADEGMTMIVSDDGVEFSFKTSDEQSFFNKYYNAALMTDCMCVKDKYKFKNSKNEVVMVKKVGIDSIKNATFLYIPAEMNDIMKKSCEIFLSRGTFGEKIKHTIINGNDILSDRILDKLGDNAEFAIFDMNACKFYEPINVELPCKNFEGYCNLNFLAEYTVSQIDFENILEDLFNYYCDFENDEAYELIKYLVKVLKNDRYLFKYVETRLKKMTVIDEKIGLLLKFNNKFKLVEEWPPHFNFFGKALFEEGIKSVNIENIIYKRAVFEPLAEKLKMNRLDFISQFSANIKDEDKNIIFEALLTAGFETREIFSVANVIEDYIEAVVENSNINAYNDLANKFNNIRNNLWKINEMLGIEDISSYSIKDDYNVDEFFNAYATLVKLVKDIEKYRNYAISGYNKLNENIKIFQPVHELLSLERTTSSNPEKITLKFVDEYIARGKYKEVICDLYIKLQYDLRKLLKSNLTTKAYDLIESAYREKIINKHELIQLHKMRNTRNYFQHPGLKEKSFNREDIDEWKKVVFSLEGK